MTTITVPLRTVSGLNAREHWRARSRRVKAERQAVALLVAGKAPPATPCVVWLTRVAPGNGLDDDNLPGALKGVRDELARWFGVDDRRRDVVRYRYAQERGPWGVRIEFQATQASPEPAGRAVGAVCEPNRHACSLHGVEL